ncbi:MAG TPA: LamG domain-containing protein [Cellvibrionaceae bacterium]
MALYASLFKRITFCTGLTLVMVLTEACSGGSGKRTQRIAPAPVIKDEATIAQYNGKVPNQQVQRYIDNFWSHLANRTCGNCHGAVGTAPRKFLDGQNIQSSYDATLAVVDLTSPSKSALVAKMTATPAGHNCWSASSQVCADAIKLLIENWAAAEKGAPSSATEIVLQVPKTLAKLDSLQFPSSTDSFAPLYNGILRKYCIGCHTPEALQAQQQQPYFASPDIAVAYAAAKPKINLDNPELSGFYQKITGMKHNCWYNSDCVKSGDELLAALKAMAEAIKAQVPDTNPNAGPPASGVVDFANAQIVSTGGRFDANVIALYTFKEGKGDIAYDSSGVAPDLNLRLSGDYQWEAAWGVRFNAGLNGVKPDGRAQGSVEASSKIAKQLRASGEFAIEAWVVPGNVTQEGPARIVSFAGDDNHRNFMLGQHIYNYVFDNHSEGSKATGERLQTLDASKVLQATQQHVVVNYSATDGTTLYVNGEKVASAKAPETPSLNPYDDSFALVLGREVSGNYGWAGTLRMLAIHKRPLTAQQAKTHYEVGVGQKFFMLFAVSELLGNSISNAFVVFEVQQFDSYSYLFNKPFFISLDPAAAPSNIHIKGVRIGVNGRESMIGQSFANLDTTISASNYNAKSGTPLSTIGTLVALEKGQGFDQFYLTFDVIGDKTSQRTPETPLIAIAPEAPAIPTKSDIGVRTFGQINAALALMTGVPEADVRTTYEQVKQQLPSQTTADGFVAAQQMGITQLAVKYCNVMASNAAYRSALFPGLDMNQSHFDTPSKTLIKQRLMKALLAHGVKEDSSQLVNQPSPTEVDTALDKLFVTMDSCTSDCAKKTLTAVCAASLGSAVMLLH